MSNVKVEQEITANQLLLILIAHEFNDGFKSAEFIQYTSETDPKLRKTGNPYQNVIKRTTARCALKVIYENAVNNAMVRNGDQEQGERNFEAQKMSWGNWVEIDGKKSKILLTHEGKFYIRTTFNNPNEIPEVSYFDGEGNELSKADLAPFLPSHKESKSGVVVRSYGLSSMKEVRMAGMIYKIVSKE
jgi:hypothetical protein